MELGSSEKRKEQDAVAAGEKRRIGNSKEKWFPV
jgi:hypothetical protein